MNEEKDNIYDDVNNSTSSAIPKKGNQETQDDQRKESSAYTDPTTIITGRLKNDVVLLIGPREVGKTITLMRLAIFLQRNEKVSLRPNKTFRTDEAYNIAVESFMKELDDHHYSPERTGEINFLLLDIYKNAELFCQILEAPGEAYFDPIKIRKESFPPYISDILLNREVRKAFVIFYEEGMLNNSSPVAYSSRLASLAARMNKKHDSVIILFNKCDKYLDLYEGSKPNEKQFIKLFRSNPDYKEFFGALERTGITPSYVVFSNGDFQKVRKVGEEKERERWIHSSDDFPEKLWRTIEKAIDGSWNW